MNPMRSVALIIIFVVFFMASAMHAADKRMDPVREPLTLTRIANSGVMLASGNTKILIDALFDQAHADYRSPEPEIIGKIVAGTAPFNGVDLALVTHNHPDHFAAPLAVRFLEANPAAVILAPEDAVAGMRKESNWPEIASRVGSLDLALGETAQREIAGISLAARRTLHSGKREEPMNLMFRFRFGGWSIFHEGDADATVDEYRGFGLAEAEVDLALVHYWFPLHPEMSKLLQEVIRPAHIGLTHLPIRLESDAPGKIDTVRQYYKDIFLLLPGMPARTFTNEAERAEIARVISNVIGWARTKDLDLFYGSIANDEDYVSVTPGARVIKRFEDVKQNVPFWMSPDFKYVRHELKDLEITFARCGEVAWFYCVLDDINTWKGEPACWENTRWTGVVEKRDGRWIVVQQHFSWAQEK